MENPDDYKKQVAVIMPRWCVEMILDHLDMQYDSLTQERQHFEKLGGDKCSSELEQEIQLYLDAIKQVDAQLNQA
jgi:hypothetical protein